MVDHYTIAPPALGDRPHSLRHPVVSGTASHSTARGVCQETLRLHVSSRTGANANPFQRCAGGAARRSLAFPHSAGRQARLAAALAAAEVDHARVANRSRSPPASSRQFSARTKRKQQFACRTRSACSSTRATSPRERRLEDQDRHRGSRDRLLLFSAAPFVAGTWRRSAS